MSDTSPIKILLADDDKDDCLLFEEVLDELPLHTRFTAVHDGEQLMHQLIKETGEIPHVLFLDLNMPRKNGFTCLLEIKQSEKLKLLPVIIFSTSYDEKIADMLYKNGAQHYICKPAEFAQLKKVIEHALQQISDEKTLQPPRKNFLINNFKSGYTLK